MTVESSLEREMGNETENPKSLVSTSFTTWSMGVTGRRVCWVELMGVVGRRVFMSYGRGSSSHVDHEGSSPSSLESPPFFPFPRLFPGSLLGSASRQSKRKSF